MKIINIGSCNIDKVYGLKNIVLPGETVHATGMEQYPGGKGLNQSMALAAAGVDLYHAGCIGDDGEELLDLMNRQGIRTELMKKVNDMTGHAIIQVDEKGENCIIVCSGTNSRVNAAFADEVLKDFGEGDFLFLQNEISELGRIIDIAYEKGMKIVLNPSPIDSSLFDVPLEKVSYLIVNEIEAAAFSGEENFLSWRRKHYPNLQVVLTMGRSGSLFTDGKSILRQHAYEVEVVDTTAAGDTFCGFFFGSLIHGKSASAALKIASVASAIAVSRKGASSSIPNLAEVESKLDAFTPNAIDPIECVIHNYMETSYAHATLKQLAENIGYSTTYLSAWLKKHMNTTFNDLLKNERCRQSEILLTQTDLPISEIIAKVGYTNESFFRKTFIKRTGMTPLQYRKEHQKK